MADVRAPTPSAAAEMVVPVKQELLLALSSLENRLQRSLILLFKNKKQRIIDLSRGLPKGEDLFYFQGQKLDFLAEKLPIALKGLSQKLRLKIVSISAKINIKVLEQSIFHNKTEVRSIEKQLQRMMLNSLEQFGQKLKSIERLRHNLGYRETLKRCYVVLRDIKGPLTSVEKISNSDGPITAEFFDGSLLLQKGAVRKTKTKKHDVSKNQRKLL